MIFYENIYAYFYGMFIKLKDKDPRAGALAMVVASQILTSGILLFAIRKLADWVPVINKIEVVIVYGIWVFIMYKYFYKKDRIRTILERYQAKPNNKKAFWCIVTWSTFIVPIVVMKLLS